MDCSAPGLPCPAPSPGVCSNSCPLSGWCHPAISSSVPSSLSCPQSLLASGSFPVSQLFASGGQSIGVSASVLPMNIQGWFPVGLTGLISLQSKGLLSLLQHHKLKASILWRSYFFYGPTLTSVHDHWTNHSSDYMHCFLLQLFCDPMDRRAWQATYCP